MDVRATFSNKSFLSEMAKNVTGADLRQYARDGDIENFTFALQSFYLTQRDIYETDDDGFTALMYAAQNGHSTITRLIIEPFEDIKRAKYDMVNANGYTALMLAVENDHYMIVSKLLRVGASINAGVGNSAVILASEAGNMEILELLFERYFNVPVEVNKTGIDGYTALMFAAQNSHLEAVKFLIDKGADIHAASTSNETAIDLAAVNLNFDIVTVLYENGGKLSLRAFTLTCIGISRELQGFSIYTGLTAEQQEYLRFIRTILERDSDMDIGREYDDPEFGGTHGDLMHEDVRCAFAEIWHEKNLRDEFNALTPATLGTALTEQPLPASLPAEGKFFAEIGLDPNPQFQIIGIPASNVDTVLEEDITVKALYFSGSCLLLNVPDDINSFVTIPNLIVYRCGDNQKQPEGDALIKLTFPNGTSTYVNRSDLARLLLSPHRKFLCEPFETDRIFSRYVTGSCPNITSVSHCDVLDQTQHPIARIVALVPVSADKTPARGVKRRMSTPSTGPTRKSPRFASRTARRRLMPGLAGGKMYGGFFHQLGRQILQGGGGMSPAEQKDLHDRMKTQYKMLKGY